ncbi:MAG: gliding motility-associated protein GldE [Muribaculaceae bacterium]|nr:gliding motility-associated protein GldE [Muribaculaceae bacterium]
MDPDPLSCILTNVATLLQSLISQSALSFNAPDLGSWVAIATALIGLLFSAFNSGSEIAYFSLTSKDIDGIEDDRKRKRVERLLDQPEKLLATILIGNNLVNIMIVIVLNYAMNQMFTFNSAVANFLVQSVILTFLILLFGEVIPKLYATNNNVRFATFVAPALQVFQTLFSPLSRLMVKSMGFVRKAVGKRADEISTEDLTNALQMSDVKNADEKDWLEGILKFGDKTVSEIMTPRIDIVDIDIEESFDNVIKCIVENGYSRMPVYEDNPDNIKGVLYAKDILPYIEKNNTDFKWQKLLRPVYFVPESRMIDDLLEDFRKKKIHLAVVVDEFGCTQGLATMEDVLEEIVGDIDDEYDTEEKFYTKENDDTFIFDAKTSIADFLEVTEVDERHFAKYTDEAETIAGLLLSIKGDFLQEKEKLTCGPCEFTVLKVKKYRIAKVKVHVNTSDK